MDLTEEEVDSLFPDDRGEDVNELSYSYWIRIEQKRDGCRIETDDESYRLSADEVAQMKDDLDWNSIWRAISERTKCLRYLQTTIDGSENSGSEQA